MLSLSSVTRGMAKDYYDEEGYYFKNNNSLFFGNIDKSSLYKTLGIPDKNLISTNFDKELFDELIKYNERFRSFTLNFDIPKEISAYSSASKFHENKVVSCYKESILDLAEKLSINENLNIKFKKKINLSFNENINVKGYSINSHNVKVSNCQEVLQKLMQENIEKSFFDILSKNFQKNNIPINIVNRYGNIELVENSGVVGLDMTFSVSKSESMLMFSGKEVHDDILECHIKAVDLTMKYAQENLFIMRVQHNKEKKLVNPKEIIGGNFTHYLNREKEMSLHNHVVVFNLGKHPYQDKFVTLSFKQIYENKMFLGQLYRTYRAQMLIEKGYVLEFDTKGMFNVKGHNLTKEDIEHFSTRSKQIDKACDDLGDHSQKMRDFAAQITKRPKDYSDVNEKIKSFETYMKDHNISPIHKKYKNKEYDFEKYLKEQIKEFSYTNFAFTKEDFLLYVQRNSLSEGVVILPEVVFSFLDHQIMIKEVYHEKNVLTVQQYETSKNYLYTKLSHSIAISIENMLMNSSGKSFEIPEDIISEFYKNKVNLDELKLSRDQMNAVNYICKNKDQFNFISGKAGAGKTTMLKDVIEIYKKAGYESSAIAPYGEAAKEIKIKTGTKTYYTIDSYLNRIEKLSGITSENYLNKHEWNFKNIDDKKEQKLIICDESSLSDNYRFYHLLKAADATNSKVLFVGDDLQIQPIGAGTPFRNAIQKLSLGVVMKDRQRQIEVWKYNYNGDVKLFNELKTFANSKHVRIEILHDKKYFKKIISNKKYKYVNIKLPSGADVNILKKSFSNEAVIAMGKGEFLKGMKIFDKADVIKEYNNPIDRKNKAVKLYIENYMRCMDLKKNINILFITPNNQDRKTYTKEIRDILMKNKYISQNEKEFSVFNPNLKTKEVLNFSEGDLVRFKKTNRIPTVFDGVYTDVKNNQSGIVRNIIGDTIYIETDNEMVMCNFSGKDCYPYLDHNYVVTQENSQGKTYEKVLISLSSEYSGKLINGNSMYVILSRHTDNILVLTDNKEKLFNYGKDELKKISKDDLINLDLTENIPLKEHIPEIYKEHTFKI